MFQFSIHNTSSFMEHNFASFVFTNAMTDVIRCMSKFMRHKSLKNHFSRMFGVREIPSGGFAHQWRFLPTDSWLVTSDIGPCIGNWVVLRANHVLRQIKLISRKHEVQFSAMFTHEFSMTLTRNYCNKNEFFPLFSNCLPPSAEICFVFDWRPDFL